MATPCPWWIFERATAVTLLDWYTYSAYLDPAWYIGKAARDGRQSTSREPIGLQISFQRRTFPGRAILAVEEIKLGARVSTFHVRLYQAKDEPGPKESPARTGELEVMVLAYVTLSLSNIEQDPAVTGLSSLSPSPPGSLPNGRIDFERLAHTGEDGDWRIPRAHVKLYSPASTMLLESVEERRKLGAMEASQILGVFPGQDTTGAMTGSGLVQFWYPTVSMNIQLKTRLGVKWLQLRVVTRMLRGSRADREVLILDEAG
ncbi:thioesterase-like superfamily-domain-containing protein [Aspergillus multicolor]|uniref:thioesterase-like superfamily-domain-containing protein n=1 Tax=Aspergillus multicolor TaxID=41759 RepID=UPI003CCE24D2